MLLTQTQAAVLADAPRKYFTNSVQCNCEGVPTCNALNLPAVKSTEHLDFDVVLCLRIRIHLYAKALICQTPAKDDILIDLLAENLITQLLQTDELLIISAQVTLQLIDLHAQAIAERQLELLEQKVVERDPLRLREARPVVGEDLL